MIAQEWARDAADEMRKKGSEMNPKIAEKLPWILGDDGPAQGIAEHGATVYSGVAGKSDEPIKRGPVRNRPANIHTDGFASVGAFTFSDMDVYSPQWKSQQNFRDVVCAILSENSDSIRETNSSF